MHGAPLQCAELEHVLRMRSGYGCLPPRLRHLWTRAGSGEGSETRTAAADAASKRSGQMLDAIALSFHRARREQTWRPRRDGCYRSKSPKSTMAGEVAPRCEPPEICLGSTTGADAVKVQPLLCRKSTASDVASSHSSSATARRRFRRRYAARRRVGPGFKANEARQVEVNAIHPALSAARHIHASGTRSDSCANDDDQRCYSTTRAKDHSVFDVKRKFPCS